MTRPPMARRGPSRRVSSRRSRSVARGCAPPSCSPTRSSSASRWARGRLLLLMFVRMAAACSCAGPPHWCPPTLLGFRIIRTSGSPRAGATVTSCGLRSSPSTALGSFCVGRSFSHYNYILIETNWAHFGVFCDIDKIQQSKYRLIGTYTKFTYRFCETFITFIM